MDTDIRGKSCKLLKSIRDRRGQSHAKDSKFRIIRPVKSLDRPCFLLDLGDGQSMLVFEEEIELIEE